MMMQRAAPAAQDAERRAPPGNARGARMADLRPGSYDAAAHTVEAVLSAGSPVTRWGFVEQLDITPQAIDLSRVDRGLVSLLDTHNQFEIDAVLGTVGNVRIEAGQLIGTLRFGQTDAAIAAEAMVARGEVRGVSIGYCVSAWTLVSEDISGLQTWRATSWELMEVSLVPVPADPVAGIRSAAPIDPGSTGSSADNQEEDPMLTRSASGGAAAASAATNAQTEPAVASAATATAVSSRAAEPAAPPPAVTEQPATRRHAAINAVAALSLLDMARSFGDTVVTRATDLIAQNDRDEIGIDQVRAGILTEAAAQQRQVTGTVPTGGRAIEIPGQQFEARGVAMANALLNRANPARYPLDDQAREFRGQNLRGLARGWLESTGMRTAGMSDAEVAQIAMQQRSGGGMLTTSDFPNILGSIVRRTLRDAYELAPRTYQAWSRRATAVDFRAITRVALSDAPALAQVQEHGEYTYGSMGEGAESYKVAKFGKVIAITWESIINDDMNALSRVPAAFGASAAQKEGDIAYNILTSNPTMADGTAVFASGRGNLAGTGAAISIASLSAGRAAMRKVKSPQGQPMNVTPGILLVGPDKELEANQFTSANYVAATAGTINPDFNRNLMVVVDPRISGNQWYLIVDPAQSMLDTIEYAYLDGEEGVMIEQRVGFEVDGLEIKARLVFGAAAIDWRGLYSNPGA